MTGKKKRITQKPERNIELYNDYCVLLKEQPLSKFLAKSYFTFILSEKYKISEGTVGRIINEMEKNATR